MPWLCPTRPNQTTDECACPGRASHDGLEQTKTHAPQAEPSVASRALPGRRNAGCSPAAKSTPSHTKASAGYLAGVRRTPLARVVDRSGSSAADTERPDAQVPWPRQAESCAPCRRFDELPLLHVRPREKHFGGLRAHSCAACARPGPTREDIRSHGQTPCSQTR